MAAGEQLNCSLHTDTLCLSSHGTCNIETGLCECHDGWTGDTEFIRFEGTDCYYPLVVIKTLWTVACAAHFRIIYFCLIMLREKIHENKLKDGIMIAYYPPFQTVFLSFCSSLLFILCGMMVIIMNERRGVHHASTIAFFLALSSEFLSEWIGWSELFKAVTPYIPGQTKQVSNVEKGFYLTYGIINFVYIVICAVTYAAAVHVNNTNTGSSQLENGKRIYRLIAATTIMCSVLLFLLIKFVTSKMLTLCSLLKGRENIKDIDKRLDKLIQISQHAAKNCIFCCVLYSAIMVFALPYIAVTEPIVWLMLTDRGNTVFIYQKNAANKISPDGPTLDTVSMSMSSKPIQHA